MQTVNRFVLASIYFFIAGIVAILVSLIIPHGYLVIAIALSFAGAFMCALLSLVRIICNPQQYKGVIITIFMLLLSCGPCVLIYGTFVAGRCRAERAKILSSEYNLKIIANTLEDYVAAHNGYLPESDKWCDALLAQANSKCTKKSFLHPMYCINGLKGNCHFAFNSNLSGVQLSSIPKDTVLVFESDGEWNLSGGPELLRKRYKKHGCISFLLTDFSLKDYWFDEKAIKTFENGKLAYKKPRWRP